MQLCYRKYDLTTFETQEYLFDQFCNWNFHAPLFILNDWKWTPSVVSVYYTLFCKLEIDSQFDSRIMKWIYFWNRFAENWPMNIENDLDIRKNSPLLL